MQQDDIQATFARVLEEVAKVNRTEVARNKRLREDLGSKLSPPTRQVRCPRCGVSNPASKWRLTAHKSAENPRAPRRP